MSKLNQWLAAFLVLSTMGLFLSMFVRPSEKRLLNIRIVGAVAKTSPLEVEWLLAVPPEKNGRPAVLYWSLTVEQTNKGNLATLPLELIANEGKLMDIDLRPKEEGILMWWPGSTLKPEMVFRTRGGYYVPTRLEEMIVSRRLFFLSRFLPKPKVVYATSEWFEVTTQLK